MKERFRYSLSHPRSTSGLAQSHSASTRRGKMATTSDRRVTEGGAALRRDGLITSLNERYRTCPGRHLLERDTQIAAPVN